MKYTEAPGRAIMNLNLAEVRWGGWGIVRGWWREEFYFQAPQALEAPFPQYPPTAEFQGKVFNSPGQGSPASHSWLLLQSAPRKSRTPV